MDLMCTRQMHSVRLKPLGTKAGNADPPAIWNQDLELTHSPVKQLKLCVKGKVFFRP